MSNRTVADTPYLIPMVLKKWEVEELLQILDWAIAEKDAEIDYCKKIVGLEEQRQEHEIELEVLLKVHEEIMKKGSAIRE